mmetsp:Transcript_4030/g.7129  ORF Transcript_4030/g.7129 Transcript_4030/m.7129 type:complete len:811 (+) Transcript_4030:177-2609(+)
MQASTPSLPPRLSVSHSLRAEFVRGQSDHSLNAPKVHSCLQPKKFVVPRGVVRRAFQVIDQVESPDAPGEVRFGAVMAALQRFYKTFGSDLHREKVLELMKQLDVPEEGGRTEFKEVQVAWSNDIVFDAFHVALGPLERLYFTLDMAENSNYASQLVSLIVFTAVMLSLVTWQLGTVEGISEVFCEGTKINECMPQPPRWMQKLEDFCVWIFTGEILLRLISVSSARRNLLNQFFLVALISGDLEVSEIQQTSFQRFCSFIISPSCVFDVLSVVPYWAEMIIFVNDENQEISILRMLYLARVTRVFKLTRALNADLGQLNEVHDLFRKVLIRASPAILMTVLLIATALFFFGTLIWYAERGEWVHVRDPRYMNLTVERSRDDGAWLRKSKDGLTDELSPFDSIPGAFWWTIVTITTVGYGDQVPVTYQGKLVGAFAMLYGTVILGLPLFVVGATFGQEYDRLMKESKRRQDALNVREGTRDPRGAAEKAREHRNAIKTVIDEQSALAAAFEEHCPVIGVSLELAARWMESVRAAQLDNMPSVAIDRVGMRVLNAVADAEELSLPASMANGVPTFDLPVKLGQKEAERQASCRKIRNSWHKFALASTHLSNVPHGMIVRALTDPDDNFSAQAKLRMSLSGHNLGVNALKNSDPDRSGSTADFHRRISPMGEGVVKRFVSDPSLQKRTSREGAVESSCSDPDLLQRARSSPDVSQKGSSKDVATQADTPAHDAEKALRFVSNETSAPAVEQAQQKTPEPRPPQSEQESSQVQVVSDDNVRGPMQCCMCAQLPDDTAQIVTVTPATEQSGETE